jgi:hypothetical protein
VSDSMNSTKSLVLRTLLVMMLYGAIGHGPVKAEPESAAFSDRLEALLDVAGKREERPGDASPLVQTLQAPDLTADAVMQWDSSSESLYLLLPSWKGTLVVKLRGVNLLWKQRIPSRAWSLKNIKSNPGDIGVGLASLYTAIQTRQGNRGTCLISRLGINDGHFHWSKQIDGCLTPIVSAERDGPWVLVKATGKYGTSPYRYSLHFDEGTTVLLHLGKDGKVLSSQAIKDGFAELSGFQVTENENMFISTSGRVGDKQMSQISVRSSQGKEVSRIELQGARIEATEQVGSNIVVLASFAEQVTLTDVKNKKVLATAGNQSSYVRLANAAKIKEVPVVNNVEDIGSRVKPSGYFMLLLDSDGRFLNHQTIVHKDATMSPIVFMTADDGIRFVAERDVPAHIRKCNKPLLLWWDLDKDLGLIEMGGFLTQKLSDADQEGSQLVPSEQGLYRLTTSVAKRKKKQSKTVRKSKDNILEYRSSLDEVVTDPQNAKEAKTGDKLTSFYKQGRIDPCTAE